MKHFRIKTIYSSNLFKTILQISKIFFKIFSNHNFQDRQKKFDPNKIQVSL